MATDTVKPGYLKPADAARYLGISTSQIRALCRKGRGPRFVRVGRSVRFPLQALDAWMSEHAVDQRESA
jgi:excisionase family DNA binding protein